MKKLLLFLLIITVLGATRWYYRLPRVIDHVRSSVVYIQVQSMRGDRWSGSGVVVEDGLILTAGHVVADANNVCVRFDDGTELKAFEFFAVETIDAGLIVIENFDGELPKGFRLKAMLPNISDTIFAIGSPFGEQNSLTVGVFSAYDRYIQDERLHQLDINGAPGMSGCPVFDRCGNVVGIIVRGNSYGMVFITPSETCRFVVDVYENVQKAKTE